MTASWHVVAMLLTVSRMSKVDYRSEVFFRFWLKSNRFFVLSADIPEESCLQSATCGPDFTSPVRVTFTPCCLSCVMEPSVMYALSVSYSCIQISWLLFCWSTWRIGLAVSSGGQRWAVEESHGLPPNSQRAQLHDTDSHHALWRPEQGTSMSAHVQCF